MTVDVTSGQGNRARPFDDLCMEERARSSAKRAASGNHVGRVVCGSTSDQMRDVDARRIVAGVPSDERIANFEAEQNPSHEAAAPDRPSVLALGKDGRLIKDATGGIWRFGDLVTDPFLSRLVAGDAATHTDNYTGREAS